MAELEFANPTNPECSLGHTERATRKLDSTAPRIKCVVGCPLAVRSQSCAWFVLSSGVQKSAVVHKASCSVLQ